MVYDAPDDWYLYKHGLFWCMTLLIFLLIDFELLVLLELNFHLDRSGDELCFDWVEIDMPNLQCRKVALICLELLRACVKVLGILLAFVDSQVSGRLQQMEIKIRLV